MNWKKGFRRIVFVLTIIGGALGGLVGWCTIDSCVFSFQEVRECFQTGRREGSRMSRFEGNRRIFPEEDRFLL